MRQDSVSAAQTSKPAKQFTKVANPVHVSMWRQRQRIRVYLNEEKVWDLPRAFLATAKLNMLVFGLRVDDAEGEYYIGNLRLAVGAPDTRNKLLTEGKWVTHGILFDVNSDRVKPRVVRRAEGDRRRAHRERRPEGADRRPHRRRWRRRRQPGSVEAPRRVREGRAREASSPSTRARMDDRRQGRRPSRSTRTTRRPARPTTGASSSSRSSPQGGGACPMVLSRRLGDTETTEALTAVSPSSRCCR